jgi:asparagine synthase (glutamine-hydrolysing)
MCGISAIVTRDSGRVPAALDRMVSVMQHRGPDDSGTYIDAPAGGPTVALGHNRLSIIDLTRQAAQPMKSRSGRYVLVYNGEVYNYRELAGDLDPVDLPAGMNGDTAVILAALAKWGPDALARFNGMWALIVYDTVERTLLVSRDRFGVKPLYYLEDGDTMYFASEIKAILAASGARFRINPDVAVPYLTRGLLNFSDQTFFEGIRQFPPGSYQRIDLREDRPKKHHPMRYWQHPYELHEHAEPGRVSPEEVRSLFVDAVRLRLRSDVPLGVLLSGGVDSSSIVGAIASIAALDNLTVLSVTSDDARLNEEPYVDMMARHVNLVPTKINVSRQPAALLDSLSDACWYNDEPVCGIADIAHLRLMERARASGIKVLLSGQGADEQLGGYNKFLYFWMQSLVRERRYAAAAKTLLMSAMHSHTLYEFRVSEAIRYVGHSRLSNQTFIAAAHQHRDPTDLGLQDSYPAREWLDLVRTSVPALLHYEDRMSMSRSVEVRVPFLDYRLVECLARVHPSEKFAGGRSKAIFRKAIEGLVPRGIQYRRDKKGFGVPEDDWMKVLLRPRVEEMFAPGMLAESLGLLDSAKLRTLYARFAAGGGYLNGRHFCRVYAFEAFARRFAAHIES